MNITKITCDKCDKTEEIKWTGKVLKTNCSECNNELYLGSQKFIQKIEEAKERYKTAVIWTLDYDQIQLMVEKNPVKFLYNRLSKDKKYETKRI